MYFPLSFASDWLSFTYKFSDSLFFICIFLFRQPLTSPSFTYKISDSLFFICIFLFRLPLASPSFTYKFSDSLFFICILLFRLPLASFHLHINFLILYFLYVFFSFVCLWLTSGVFATTLQLRFSRMLLSNSSQSYFTSSNVRGVPLEMSFIAVFPSISS